jgi:ABC-2 type transport system ATP-binding protein
VSSTPSRHPKPQSSRHPQSARVSASSKASSAAPTAALSTPVAVQARTDGALDTHRLAKFYGDRPALLPVDLHIDRGERVAVVGHNGSGKTTLIRMAAGLLDPTDGKVFVTGNAVGTMAARQALAYLSDTPTFYDDLSVWEHLEYVARLHSVVEWEQLAADLLGHLGLYERADELPNTFSRGLRQKAAIALAFVRPFEVLLVDEPFVGLDQLGRGALLELLDQAGDDGAALIVATHELSYVNKVSRLIALRDGSVIHDGSPTEAAVGDLVDRHAE